jgi:hypothetical protein
MYLHSTKHSLAIVYRVLCFVLALSIHFFFACSVSVSVADSGSGENISTQESGPSKSLYRQFDSHVGLLKGAKVKKVNKKGRKRE